MFFKTESFFSQNLVHLHLKASLVSLTKRMWLSILIHRNYLRTHYFWSFQLQPTRNMFFQDAPSIYLNPDVGRQLFISCLFPYPSSSLLLSTQALHPLSLRYLRTGNSIQWIMLPEKIQPERRVFYATWEEGQINGKSEEIPTSWAGLL